MDSRSIRSIKSSGKSRISRQRVAAVARAIKKERVDAPKLTEEIFKTAPKLHRP